MKAMYRNIMQCSQAYARTCAKIATTIKVTAMHLKNVERSKSEGQTTLMHQFCARVEATPMIFEPKIVVGTQLAIESDAIGRERGVRELGHGKPSKRVRRESS